MLQVDFWHAYREFFTTDDRVEPMLTAAEMIKNVALAFPGTGAKVMMGPNGVQKFVIAGLGFRKDVRKSSSHLGLLFCRVGQVLNITSRRQPEYLPMGRMPSPRSLSRSANSHRTRPHAPPHLSRPMSLERMQIAHLHPIAYAHSPPITAHARHTSCPTYRPLQPAVRLLDISFPHNWQIRSPTSTGLQDQIRKFFHADG